MFGSILKLPLAFMLPKRQLLHMPKQDTYPCPHLVVDHAGRCEHCLEWLGEEKSSPNYLVGIIAIILFMAFTGMCIEAGLRNWHPKVDHVHTRR